MLNSGHTGILLFSLRMPITSNKLKILAR